MGYLSEEKKFYVYAHIRKDNGSIFYIGKGSGKRANVVKKRNKHWTNVANKAGYTIKILHENLTEYEAMNLEIKIISEIGLDNLCNMTNGGEGTSGFKMSDEQKKVLISNLTGRKFSKETREKISKALTGKKRDSGLVEAHAAMMRGRKHSKEHVEKIRASLIGRVCSEYTRDKISKAHIGSKRTYEARLKMSESHIGSKRTLESRKKQSETMLYIAQSKNKDFYRKLMKKISCSNGMEFESLSAATKWMSLYIGKNASKSMIGKCASGMLKTAYNLQWRYID